MKMAAAAATGFVNVGFHFRVLRRAEMQASLRSWVVLGSFAAGACASSGNVSSAPRSVPPAVPTAACKEAAAEKASAPSNGAPASYVALFDALSEKIEAHHVFAERPKASWPANKAQLRSEFERVKTREDALVSLDHLQAALRDRHCRLSPPTDKRVVWLGLGVSLFAESIGARKVVRVDEVLDRALPSSGEHGLAEGDEIVAVDGRGTEQWLADHPFESNSLNDIVADDEQANAIVIARLPWSSVKEGDTRRLRVRRGGEERDVTLAFSRTSGWQSPTDINFDDAPSMASIGCRDDKNAPYADFVLSAVGSNVCVYRPKSARGAIREGVRLVRFVSFDYGGSADALRATKADHAILKRELTGASSVVLDLHENRGGNNPFVFLSWFAKKPWDHPTVHVRVSKDFSSDDRRAFLWGDDALIARYEKAMDEGRPEESWPFLCRKDGKTVTSGACESQGPRTSELVTTAPIAIVTGPECTSSCDSIVSNWSAMAMGPLVGQQPAHGFTTIRHAYPLIGPDGRDLGRFRIALSWEGYPRTGRSLEGAPVRLDWEAPRTFATRKTWVDLAVAEAAHRAGKMR